MNREEIVSYIPILIILLLFYAAYSYFGGKKNKPKILFVFHEGEENLQIFIDLMNSLKGQCRVGKTKHVNLAKANQECIGNRGERQMILTSFLHANMKYADLYVKINRASCITPDNVTEIGINLVPNSCTSRRDCWLAESKKQILNALA